MPPRAIIFDWDLTLWNSLDIHLLLMARTARDLGIPPPSPAAVTADYHRPFLRHLLHFFGSRPDAEDELPRIEAIYLQHYYALPAGRNYLYPGIASLLRMLKRNGHPIGILSDKRAAFGDPELAQSGIAHLVDCATFHTGAHPYKPHPAGLRHTLAMLDTAPANALYIGDAPHDLACARNAGATPAAALWAALDRSALLDAHPDYALHNPQDLLTALNRHPGTLNHQSDDLNRQSDAFNHQSDALNRHSGASRNLTCGE